MHKNIADGEAAKGSGSGTSGRVSIAHNWFLLGACIQQCFGDCAITLRKLAIVSCSMHFFNSFPLETDLFFCKL